MPTRDFDAMLAEVNDGRPQFTAGGQTFTARSKLSWRKFLSLAEIDGDNVDEGEAVSRFFSKVLLPADRDRFLALLEKDDDDDDDTGVIAPSQVTAITEWLMSYYTGKAQTNASSSTDGPGNTGQPSRVVSLSARSQTG